MAFSKETFAFLADLEAHNSKDWFDANRDRYEAHWRDPALAFIDALAPHMGALEVPLKAEARLNGSLRRINRDVRFSKDKTPYNARLHLIFWSGGHPNRSPGMHFVLTPTGVGYGAGAYGFDAAMIKRYRDRVVDPGAGDALEQALDRAGEVGSTIGEPDLARLPKGYEAEGRAAQLLRYKSVVARTHGTAAQPGVLIGPDAVRWAMDITQAHVPLLKWLQEL